MKRIKPIVLLLFLLAIGCTKKSPTEPSFEELFRGEIIKTKTLSTYSASLILQLVTLAGYEVPHDLQYTVKVVSITYVTLDGLGEKVKASGAVMIPQGVDDIPLLSLQHGTVYRRDEVASVSPLNSVEGMVGTLMASLGYVVCVPDYVGYGVSEEMHPYIHAQSLAVSVIDFLRAVRDYCSTEDILLSGQIFLTGYSEGGYATMATHKEIEENYAGEFQLTAVAPMAGSYDLTTMMQNIFQSADYKYVEYLAYIFTAWDHIYQWNRLNDVFYEPYASRMPDLYDGTKGRVEINRELPNDFTELVKAEFIQGVREGTETEVLAVVQENTLLDWAPNAPVRLYHGTADRTVPYYNATTALASLTDAGGTSVELISIQGGTHVSSALPSALAVIDWFAEFRQPVIAKPSEILISDKSF